MRQMIQYHKLAISFGLTKEAALYFDNVIPVYAAAELLSNSVDIVPWPRSFVDGLLPADLYTDPNFINRLVDVNTGTLDLMLKLLAKRHGLPPKIGGVSDGDYPHLETKAAEAYFTFVNDFDLADVPVVTGSPAIMEGDSASADVAVTLSTLELVDASKTSWEAIAEFRRDSVDKL